MAQNDDDKLRDVHARFFAKLRDAGFNFAAGVNANRSPAPTIACAGCMKTLTPAELAGVTPFGPLCAECNAGLSDRR